MPTIVTHAAPFLASGLAVGIRRYPVRLFWIAVLCAMLPDLDAIGFRLGIKYADILGHRGFSHSLLFAALCGGIGYGLAPLLRCRRWVATLVIFLAVSSHILLDAATNGGLGVAAFWPFSDARYFLPWRPIQVSPLSLHAFWGERGLKVVISELKWVWLPCFTLALLYRGLAYFRR